MTSQISSRTDGDSGPTLILAVDTSTASGSLAIAEFKNSVPTLLTESRWDKLAMHSEVATAEVASALKKTNLSLKDITHYAVNVGPGSFTGLRVGINLIRTLAYSFDRPVAMFTSLEAIAFFNSQENERTLVAIKAIQNYFYAAAYQKSRGGMRTLVEPFSGTQEEVDALGTYDQTIVEGMMGASLATTAQTLVEMSTSASFSSWKNVKPLYVRASEAEEKLKKGILKPLP